VIEVHTGDPDTIEDTWADELAGPDDQYVKFASPGGALPLWEIGDPTGFSGMFWWRRGTISIDSYFLEKGYDRDKSRQVHNALRRAVEEVLGDLQGSTFRGLTDSSGKETVIAFMPVKSTGRESGGPPSSFIWRGKVWWQALVSRT
jgi:hypothetical protein